MLRKSHGMRQQPRALGPGPYVITIMWKGIIGNADCALGPFFLFVFGEAVADDGLHDTTGRIKDRNVGKSLTTRACYLLG